jgi:methylmalonyl-CoA mutase N-terminal domain/subunit
MTEVRSGEVGSCGARSGEVGRGAVAVDSIDDMRVLFGGIPLDRVSLSMTIDAPAAPLLLLCQIVAEEQGVAARRLTGTIRDKGNCVFPPGPSRRLSTDVLAYCRAEIPNWYTASPVRRLWARMTKEELLLHLHTRPAGVCHQNERLAKLRAWRCSDRVGNALIAVRKEAGGDDNVLHPMKDALAAGATVGEVCDVLREVWGTCDSCGAHVPAVAQEAL